MPAPATSALPDVTPLLGMIRERAGDTERERTLPADVVAGIEDAGLFRILRHRDVHGLELPPVEVVDVVERIAHADASTAWAVLIGATSSAFFSWLDPDTATEMLRARPASAATCVLAPTGTAVAEGDTVRVSGRWQWNSGVLHSPWRQVVAAVVGADGTPATSPTGAPRTRVVFLSDEQSRVVDTWNTMGLRGTGSHDLVVEDTVVPADRTFELGVDTKHGDGPYGRIGIGELVNLGVVAFPLGVARRALDEFVGIARTKSRGMSERWVVAEDSEVQADIGRAQSELAAARAFADDAASGLWSAAQDPDQAMTGASGRLAMATGHALRASIRVVDTVFRHAGASSMRLEDPIQRCFRDLHAVAGHVFYSSGTDRTVGRAVLGLSDGAAR